MVKIKIKDLRNMSFRVRSKVMMTRADLRDEIKSLELRRKRK